MKKEMRTAQRRMSKREWYNQQINNPGAQRGIQEEYVKLIDFNSQTMKADERDIQVRSFVSQKDKGPKQIEYFLMDNAERTKYSSKEEALDAMDSLVDRLLRDGWTLMGRNPRYTD